eukprot:SAG31_NODE_20419_length_575_cov_0.775210_1_plen_34_part_10
MSVAPRCGNPHPPTDMLAKARAKAEAAKAAAEAK